MQFVAPWNHRLSTLLDRDESLPHYAAADECVKGLSLCHQVQTSPICWDTSGGFHLSIIYLLLPSSGAMHLLSIKAKSVLFFQYINSCIGDLLKKNNWFALTVAENKSWSWIDCLSFKNGEKIGEKWGNVEKDIDSEQKTFIEIRASWKIHLIHSMKFNKFYSTKQQHKLIKS